MKKYFAFIFALALCACGGMVKNENGSQFLTQLTAEPIGCTFLYKIESEISVYDADDARRYLENRIADQARGGNAYWVVAQRTRPNEWVLFGPERSFVLTANVYDCPYPNKVRTARDGDGTVAVAPIDSDTSPCRPNTYTTTYTNTYGGCR